jgi:hypothetical protein
LSLESLRADAMLKVINLQPTTGKCSFCIHRRR